MPVLSTIKCIFSSTIRKGLFILTTMVCFSCQFNTPPDISDIDLEINIRRFENDLFSQPLYNINQSVDSLHNAYPHFFPMFSQQVIGLANYKNPNYNSLLQSMVTHYLSHQTYKTVQKKFPDLSWLENDLSTAFKYYKYYFHEKTIPEICTFIGVYNNSLMVSENILAIALEMYLGSDEENYLLFDPPFQRYERYTMRRESIVPDCIYAWVSTEFIFNDSVNNLVNHMVYQGKVMYAMDKLLPTLHDTLKFGFTPNQLTFCENNDRQMWTYLIENKLLFIKNEFKINQFINKAPFTKDFSSESPGQAAIWLGREIIRAYMQKNKNIDLLQLMKNDNYQAILNQSGYNP